MQKEKNQEEILATNTDEQVECKNCSHTYSGNFCPQCGQSKKEFDRPLKFFFVDFAGNIFAFDTRLWKSLKHILFHPGRMETNYISGQRVRYMPPFRLYVFVSFIFFLSLSWATGRAISKNKAELNILHSGEAMSDSILNELRTKHPEITISWRNKNETSHRDTLADEGSGNLPGIVNPNNEQSSTQAKMSHIMENPEMYMSRFFKYASWSLFLLMPFYGFLLWLNFRKSKRNYVSHFLLSVNQHVFIYVILLLILFTGLAFPTRAIQPEKYLLYLFPVYAWVGAVRLYQRHWLKTGIRLLVLTVFYLFVVAMATAFIAWVSFT